ncbi:hypothetical protein [Flavobacterium sp.]|uniref:hypothetical protein n=1 Tax=Flavobacterium sp. TaxID=239 RepID=UPI0037535600
MGKHSQIKKLLEGFGLKANFPITATVVSIQNDTCTVKLQSSLVLSDVRLKATITEETDSFLIIPKVGSDVIVFSQTGELSGLMVIKVNSVEKIQYKKGAFECEIDGTTEKVLVKNATANLGDLIADLIGAIKAMSFTVTTPDTINGSTTALVNLAQFSAIEMQFKQLLK